MFYGSFYDLASQIENYRCGEEKKRTASVGGDPPSTIDHEKKNTLKNPCGPDSDRRKPRG